MNGLRQDAATWGEFDREGWALLKREKTRNHYCEKHIIDKAVVGREEPSRRGGRIVELTRVEYRCVRSRIIYEVVEVSLAGFQLSRTANVEL